MTCCLLLVLNSSKPSCGQLLGDLPLSEVVLQRGVFQQVVTGERRGHDRPSDKDRQLRRLAPVQLE
jgi:hypothetical protein